MGRGSRALRSALIFRLTVSGPAGGAKKRQKGPRDVQDGALMAHDRSERAQDRTRAFQNWSNMALKTAQESFKMAKMPSKVLPRGTQEAKQVGFLNGF